MKVMVLGLWLMDSLFALNALEHTQKDRDLLIEIRAKLYEIDKRFEQVDKRFEDQKTFMVTIISIFTAIIGTMFYYMVSRFNRHEERMAQLVEQPQSLEKLILALRANPALRRELREVLKAH
jgi:hypothetical protein